MSLAKRVCAVLALVTASQIVYAQHDHDSRSSVPNYFKEPMPLYPKALGKFTRPISSSNQEAQAYFDQGFQLKYAFDKIGAIRSFREAEKRDPNCAICYWGEAWSWGSFLNGKMQDNEAPFALAAIRQARHLAGHHANTEERAFIQAMSVRYVKGVPERGSAYADAMRRVHEQFPNDVDGGALYGEALFILEPRRGWRDIRTPNVQRILRVLEAVLAIDSRHVGACHLYIHLTEATTEPAKAEACADSI